MPRPPRTDPALASIRIESLAAGGDGVGRDAGGRVVFVPQTAPGDHVRVRLVESRKRFARGELVELLEPGPGRTDPVCPLVGRCGGCAWQHLDYTAQLDAKVGIVGDALRRIGRFVDLPPVAITASPAYGYRTRTRLVQSEGRLGYRMRRSHRIAVTDVCPVLDPSLARVLKSGKPADSGTDGDEWEAAVGGDGRPRLDRSAGPGGSVELAVASDRLRISHGVFAQANGPLLESLAARVVDRCAPGSSQCVSAVELYAGAGLFTLGLSRRFDQVWAVESHPGAVEDLRFNLTRAERSNVRVTPGEVEAVLPRLGIRAPDALLLDPPRAGLSPAALEAVLQLAPTRITYLSCDPATLARDLSRLRDEGYRLGEIEAFDLFPQTPHVEALATLERVARPGADSR